MRIRRIARAVLAAGLVVLADHPGGRAADANPQEANRIRLDEILAVLRLRADATSPGCVAALEEMHTSEDQLKSLSDGTNEPTESQRHANRQDDLAIARDVLGSDMDNAIAACGPDAKAVCAAHPIAGDRQCGAL